MGHRYQRKTCLVKSTISEGSLEYFDTRIQGSEYEGKTSNGYDQQVLGITIPPSSSGPGVGTFVADQTLDDAIAGNMYAAGCILLNLCMSDLY